MAGDVRIESSAGVISDLCEQRLRDRDDTKEIRELLRMILGQTRLILQANRSNGPDPDMEAIRAGKDKP